MLTLVIANKNYSSWSLRPWLAMRHLGIAFEEIFIGLDQPDTKAEILKHSPAGKVPALKDGEVTVWESLAILEYLNERFPDAGLWPHDRAARAHARAISSEMHAGFQALRRAMPMNLRKRFAKLDRGGDVASDVTRICDMWCDCRRRHGGEGAFLFGAFTAADAMFAPIVTRFRTYSIDVDPVCRAYMETILALPAFLEWEAAARVEPWVLAHDEVDEPELTAA